MKLKDVFLEATNQGDETLWEDEWIAVKKKDDLYTYTHSIKSDGKGVAVLGYSYDDEDYEDTKMMVLGRYEDTPPHGDGITLTSLTGMVEKGDTPLETAVKELKEESGISVDASKLEEIGTVMPSKSSDTVIHLFAVDLSSEFDGAKEFFGDGDGTKGEEGSYCKFVSIDDATESKCPLLSVMILRALRQEL